MLNQLGALVLIFLATACQASSSENQEKNTIDQAVTEVQVPDNSLTEGQQIVLEEETIDDSNSPALKREEAETIAPVVKSQVPKAKAVAYQPEVSQVEEKITTSIKNSAEETVSTEVIEETATQTPDPTATVPPSTVTPAEVPAEKISKEEVAVEKVGAPSHDPWNKLLTQYVSSTGKVNYRALKGKEADLDAYLKSLADNPVQSSWSRNEKMAYWINAYNAFTVKLILDNYPLSSIINLSGGKVWDKKWIKLGGKTYSLNNIEHDILRPQFKDARIHFAVNCAAKSCPPLLNRAWTADNLNSNLSAQAKKFINSAKYNQIGADKVAISKIFEWYAVDFGNIVEYLNKYATTKISANATVNYQEYDWALNQ